MEKSDYDHLFLKNCIHDCQCQVGTTEYGEKWLCNFHAVIWRLISYYAKWAAVKSNHQYQREVQINNLEQKGKIGVA